MKLNIMLVKKFGLILTTMILIILLMPSYVVPVKSDIISSPVPIPGNLISTIGPSLPVSSPALPNLGTVSLSPLPISVYSVNQVQSGLIAYDSLTNETKTQQQLQANSGYWTYGGDAPLFNAPYAFWKDTQGLHIGVQAQDNGSWAGYYGVTPNTNAKLFHALVTTPVQTVPSNNNWYENGLYVQNGTGNVSYVVCTSNTSVIGTQWFVAATKGNSFGVTNETILWNSNMDLNEPRTADCTIITNGSNYLKVILDGTPVYESNTMNLQFTNPLVAFLEPQTSYAGQILNGTYQNYYATSDANIHVTNNPVLAAKVDLIVPISSTTGQVVATASVDSSGTATFNMENFAMPLNAYIKSYDSNGIQLASTPNTVNIFGGDVYSVNVNPNTILAPTTNQTNVGISAAGVTASANSTLTASPSSVSSSTSATASVNSTSKSGSVAIKLG